MKFMLSLIMLLLIINCGYQDPNAPQVNDKPFTLEGKLAISEDNGKNWKPLDQHLSDDLDIFSYLADDDQLLIGTSNASLVKIDYENANENKTENIMEALINTKPIEQNRVLGIFSCPSGLYTFVNGSGIFKKSINSNYWQPISIPEGIHGVSKIIEDDNNNIFMACQYGLYKSHDDGKNWERVFTLGFANDVLIFNNTLYVAGIYGIHYSKDGGITWQQFAKIQEKIGLNNNQNTLIFQNGKRLYTSIQTYGDLMSNKGKFEILYSDDEGATWHEHDMEKFLNSKNNIQNMSMYGDNIFVSTKNELLKSKDQGKTWQAIIDLPKDQSNKTLKCILVKDRLVVIKENAGC